MHPSIAVDISSWVSATCTFLGLPRGLGLGLSFAEGPAGVFPSVSDVVETVTFLLPFPFAFFESSKVVSPVLMSSTACKGGVAETWAENSRRLLRASYRFRH